MNLLSRLACILLLSIQILPIEMQAQNASKTVAGKTYIHHSFFIAGPKYTGIIGENGEEIWKADKSGARDGYVLPNGNILICWGDEVREYNGDKKVIFNFKKSATENELGTAVRLKNGNTLITESGKTPRLLEVDQLGQIQITVPLQPETDNIHMQTRMARKLQGGNYLVPHLLAFSVKEYTASGKIVHTIKTDLPELGGRQIENWPFTAIRLQNGNTLVTLTHGNKVVEFNPQGSVVWKISNDDFEEKPFKDPCGAQRLPNGHTVIASYGASEGIRLFEVDNNKKIVWTYNGYGAHEFQILTTNGKKLKGSPLK
jgi:hypothetical protein